MNSKYCLKCNARTDFSDIPPKFCASCGQPFASSIASKVTSEIAAVTKSQPQIVYQPEPPKQRQSAAAKSLASRQRQVEIVDEDDDSEDKFSGEIPQISKIDFEISGQLRDRTTIKDLAKGAKVIENVREKSKKLKKGDEKRIIQEFYSEVTKVNRSEI